MWLDSNKFVYDKIPEIHPLSLDYLEFWREEKRRIIEGLLSSTIISLS